MTDWKLVTRSLRFHWRGNAGVLLGAILSAAMLTGALAVGDSVRFSLRRLALLRLGDVALALNGRSRFFRMEFAGEVGAEIGAPSAAVILLNATAAGQRAAGDSEGIPVGRVQALGVTEEFWRLDGSHSARALSPPSAEGAFLNDRLAARLGVRVGDDVLLHVDKPGLLSRDAPLSTVSDASVTLRLTVEKIIDDSSFGRFSLEANQIPPLNVYIRRDLLQERVGMSGRANILLIGTADGKMPDGSVANAALWKHWQFADSNLDLRVLPGRNLLELRTDRVFLDPPVASAAMNGAPTAQGALTYFVNELRVGDRATPYSTVAALQNDLIPPDMTDEQVLINQWLADDLQAKPGDRLKITYWIVGPMRRLVEQSHTFSIRSVLPMDGPARDPDLMPPIPGLAGKKDCRDWEPGVPVNLDKIRDRDQRYWERYRGTPKAFLRLSTGQRIWNNRFGNLTAVRYPLGRQSREAIEACIRQALSPASLGLFFTPVRAQARAASSNAINFGELFLGFSFFLIAAALLLMALLFVFGVEQRAEEVGTLLAVGFPARRVQRLLLREGGLLALIASIAGTALAVCYTQAVVKGLSTVWKEAVAGAALVFHVEPMTLLSGALISWSAALGAIWLVARRQARAPVRELLAAGADSESRLLAVSGRTRPGLRAPGVPTAILSTLAALGTLAAAPRDSQERAAEYFFGAGALLLIAAIAGCRIFLSLLASHSAARRLTAATLGLRNASRRLGRSLAAVALLAGGSFLVVAVGAGRREVGPEARSRAAGTGGFALYGEATLPVYSDLNTPEGREVYGLDAGAMSGISVVSLRLRDGDEASCLNLNRAQTPRLLGVDPEALRRRKAFSFTRQKPGSDLQNPWSLLEGKEPDGAIPAVGDTNTVVWSLGKALGDTVDYVDDRGGHFRLRIVGVLANSILQGGLILSEENFLRLFPAQSGYQVFLVDAPMGTAAQRRAIGPALGRALEDVGLTLSPAAERLADFNTVENTYLAIFAALGGLGMLLGSAGLGVVVLRNVLERRSELALLRAVGFDQSALRGIVFREHALLLGLGLASGILAALVAVFPTLRTPMAQTPFLSLAWTLLSILISGLFWTWCATRVATRGSLLNALRNE